MKKIVFYILIGLTAVSCGTSAGFFYPAGTAFEKGLAKDDPGSAVLYLQNDLKVEYLENIKVSFNNAGEVHIKPGQRTVTFRAENSLFITEYTPFQLDFVPGGRYRLGYDIVDGGTILIFTMARYRPETDDYAEKEVLGRTFVIRKSDNEKKSVIIP